MPEEIIQIVKPLQVGETVNDITADKLISRIGQQGDPLEHVKRVELQYVGGDGQLHSITIPVTKMQQQDDGSFAVVPIELDDIEGTLDGSSIPGFQGIDKTGLVVIPGNRPRIYVDPTDSETLVIMGNTRVPGAAECYEKDPRWIAEKAQRWLRQDKADLGLEDMYVGPEFEFFVFPKGVDPYAPNADNSAYHAGSDKNPNVAFMNDYLRALRRAGVNSKFFHGEVATYQEEIGIDRKSFFDAADDVLIQRSILLKLAKKHGVTVNWDPKLLDANGQAIKQLGSETDPINGSGLHTNLSFVRAGVDRRVSNAFVRYRDQDAGVDRENILSDDALLALDALLANAQALQAFYNPSTNSGERLGQGESPKFIIAGWDNRSALVRIATTEPGKEYQTRLEVRAADSMCQPHLWFSAALMTMVDGIEKGRALGEDELALKVAEIKATRIKNVNFYKEAELAERPAELHTGKEILVNAVASLQSNHDFLCKPGSPFGANFDDILRPYTDTITALDNKREAQRKVHSQQWSVAKVQDNFSAISSLLKIAESSRMDEGVVAAELSAQTAQLLNNFVQQSMAGVICVA